MRRVNVRFFSKRIVATAALLGLCACSQGAPTIESETEAENAPQTETSGNVPAPNDWENLTRDELEEMHTERMATVAESMGVEVSEDLALVEFVPMNEWSDRQVTCLREMGFEAESSQGGVSLGTVPSDQTDALREAMVACEFQFAADPRVSNQPLPRTAAVKLYEHWVQAMTCLRNEGYEPEEPPSLEVWLGEFYSPTTEHWDPFTVVVNDASELDAVQRECTYMPADMYPPIPSNR